MQPDVMMSEGLEMGKRSTSMTLPLPFSLPLFTTRLLPFPSLPLSSLPLKSRPPFKIQLGRLGELGPGVRKRILGIFCT